MISSLGIMNLLPIPPLDGGRFVIEVFQKLTKRQVGYKAMNIMTMTGMALFIGSLMLNQDIQRFIGNCRATERSLGIGRTAGSKCISGPNKESENNGSAIVRVRCSHCAKLLFLAVEQAERKRDCLCLAWRIRGPLCINEHDVDFGVLCGELQSAPSTPIKMSEVE